MIKKKSIQQIIEEHLNSTDVHKRIFAAKCSDITPKQLDKALADPENMVRKIALKNPNLTTEQINNEINKKDLDTLRIIAENPNLTEEQITTLINTENFHILDTLSKNKNITSSHINSYLKNNDWYIRASIVNHPSMTKEQIKLALEDHFVMVIMRVLKNKNLPNKIIDEAVKSKDWEKRFSVLGNPNIKIHHINPLLNDEKDFIRDEAIKLLHSLLDKQTHNTKNKKGNKI
jgi:hypothetical protein